jgi:hypothetical protein
MVRYKKQWFATHEPLLYFSNPLVYVSIPLLFFSIPLDFFSIPLVYLFIPMVFGCRLATSDASVSSPDGRAQLSLTSSAH